MAKDSFGNQLIRSVAVTLATLVIVLAIIGGIAYFALNQGPDIEDDSWLVLDLYGDLPEYAPPGSFPTNLLSDETLTLQDALDAMDKATRDDRVRGVIWKLSASNSAGWAKLEELRAGIRHVRDSGKPVLAYGDYLDLKTLYLAVACDSIYQPRGGYCEIHGMRRQSIHVRGLLDKLGVTPHLSKIREYKTAAEMVMETKLTPEARAQAQRLLDQNWDEVTTTVAHDRQLDLDHLLALMEKVSLRPSDAAAEGLIDRTLYWEDLEAQLQAGADTEVLPTVSAADYRDVSWEDLGHKGQQTVAVIHAQGTIGGRESGVNPLLGITMGHESVIRDLRRARLDDEVKAIVFRVDSGGGEGLASDLIGREVERCAAAKPTVVSMVDVAASGGYMISFKATKLMADPLTVVGSIGSISGWFDMSGFHEKIGLSRDTIEVGPQAGLGRDDRAPTEAEWNAFTAAHYADFNDWLHDVAAKRGMTFAQVEDLAYGRVFTGREGVVNGLIDGLGTLDTAVREAASLAGIGPETPLTVVHLPEVTDPISSLLSDEAGLDSPVTKALRWAAYRQLRQEALQTQRLLQSDVVLHLPTK